MIVALLLALWGQWIGQLFFHPVLDLDAKVQRPDADKVRRARLNGSQVTDLGEYYYLPLSMESKRPTRNPHSASSVEKSEGCRHQRRLGTRERITIRYLQPSGADQRRPAIWSNVA